MLFITCDNWKALFLYKFLVTQRFGATTMLLLFFETIILRELRIRYLLSPKKNYCNVANTKGQKKAFTS